MRRFTLFLLFLGMFLAVGLVAAQEEGTVTLYISNATNIPFNELSHYVQSLTENLSNFGFNLALTESISDTNIVLSINPSSRHRENEFEIIFEATTSPILPETNILYLTPEEPITFIVHIDRQTIAQALSSDLFELISQYIALYSINQCSSTIGIQQSLELNEAYYGDSKRMGLYVGNCKLATNDIDGAFDYYSYSASFVNHPYIYDQHSLVNLAWLYITYNLEWNGFEGWEDIEATPIELIGYEECGMFEGPCWAGTDTVTTINATPIISVTKQIELITRRAQLYALAFDYDSAIADMDEAITLAEEHEADNPTLAELYTIRGKIIFLIYEWDRVQENFNTALELDPNYAPAYFERGILYYTMTQRENALTDFQHYLELEPTGLYAEEAAQYIESIEIELDMLGN